MPASGGRYGSGVYGVQNYGGYWSAAAGGSSDAYGLGFYSNYADTNYGSRDDGLAVRLVQDLSPI